MTSGVPVQMIDLGVVSDSGRVRPRNEDAYGYEPLHDEQGRLTGWIFVVADGVGGEYHGDIASKMAVHRVIDVYKDLKSQNPLVPVTDMLRDAIHFANGEIYNKASELNVAGHMGTTLVAAVLRTDSVLHVAWVGDSRLYVLSRRMEKIRQVTQDHTEVAEQLRQRLISHDQALRHPRRNVLSRSVGGQQETRPDFIEGTLEPTDTIIICSDGLTRHLTAEHIRTLALQPVPSEQIASQMVGAANQLGGKDNVTVMVIHVGPRESQMDTPPPVANSFLPDTVETPFITDDDDRPADFDTGRYPTVSQTLPLRKTIPKKDLKTPNASRSVMMWGALAALIIVVLILAVLVALSQQAGPSAAPTSEAAIGTQESIPATEAPTQTPVPATSTLRAALSTAVPTQTALSSTSAASMAVELKSTTPAVIASQSPTSTATTAPLTRTPTAVAATPAATAAATIFVPVLSDTPAATATIVVLFAPLAEPYPRGTCLVTIREAPVYAAVGAAASYTYTDHLVVSIVRQGQSSYSSATQGGLQLYYSVKPNDGSAGAGWIKSEDVVPARNLSATEQGSSYTLTTSDPLVAETPQPWAQDQAVTLISSTLSCLPMCLKPDVPTQINIVESESEAVIIAASPVSVNGSLWWNVRLYDGREGWVQQIYLDAKS